MKNIKVTALILITAVVLILSGCDGMMGTDADDITIDLSSVIPKGSEKWVRVWMFPGDASEPIDIGDQWEQKVGINGDTAEVTIKKVPAGSSYKVFISTGKKTDGVFELEKSFYGTTAIAGGAAAELSAANLNFAARGIEPVGSCSGKNIRGITVAEDGYFYAVTNDTLLYETASNVDDISSGPDYEFNHISASKGSLIISCKNDSGRGVLRYTLQSAIGNAPGRDTSFNSQILTPPQSIDVLRTDAFWGNYNTPEERGFSLLVGQTEGKLIFNYGNWFAPGATPFEYTSAGRWFIVDVKQFLEDYGLPAGGLLINDFTVVKKYNASNEIEELWVFLISKLGNHRIKMEVSVGSTTGDLTNISDDDDIIELFEDFTAAGPLSERKLICITNPSNTDKLYIGTDEGLYEITDVISNMNPQIAYDTDGQRISLLESSSDGRYTACVTPLRLLIIDNEIKQTASIWFNEGLPAAGPLTEEITGLAWHWDTSAPTPTHTLLVAGKQGITKIEASDTSPIWD